MKESRETLPQIRREQEQLAWAERVMEQTHYETLEQLTPIPLSGDIAAIPAADVICMYQITELAVQKNRRDANQLTATLNALHACGASCFLLLQYQDGKSELYIGAVNKKRYENPFYLNTIRDILRSSIEGNLPGTNLKEVESRREIQEKLQECFDNGFDSQCITSISCVADADENSALKGLETLLEAVGNKNFSLLVLADPIDHGCMKEIRRGYENLGTQLSSLESMTVSIQKGKSSSVSESCSDSFSHGISQSLSLTQSHTSGTGWSKGSGRNTGEKDRKNELARKAAVGAGLFAMTQQPQTALFTMNAVSSLLVGPGSQNISNQTESGSENDTRGMQISDGTTDSYTRQIGKGLSNSETEGVSISQTVKDCHVSELIGRVNWYLNWLKERENYGMFDCCAYVISASAGVNLMAASQYQALLQGKGAFHQPVSINTWTRENGIEDIRKSLIHMMHPLVKCDDLETVFSPAMLQSSCELSRLMALPQKQIVGVSIAKYAAFGREVVRKNDNLEGKIARIGCISHMGKTIRNRPVFMDVQSMASHTFVAGTNGSGKSNTVFKLLEELMAAEIPFLVIEPAKGEYKNVFGREKNVHIYGTNRSKTPLLRVNPFWFNEDVEVREHINRLMDVFNASWPMYAAMPKVLEESIEAAYVQCGWDVKRSKCRDGRIFPTAKDVLREFQRKMDSTAFSAEVKGNYVGALSTRLESLCTGIYEDIFSGADLGDEALFEQNVIVDLSRVGSAETKAMLMGLLIIRLREYRGDQAVNRGLRHVTVLEEAHHLLRKTCGAQSAEGSSLVGKSVEMLTNCIAEMRSYGDGFVIVDQSPGLLDTAVIRNTNTKMILRLPEANDREIVAKAMGLNADQTEELARLKTGLCAIYQQNWLEAVLCQVDLAAHEEIPYEYDQQEDEYDVLQRKIADDILRACLKNHSGSLHASLCGIVCLHSVDVARCAALIQDIEKASLPGGLKRKVKKELRRGGLQTRTCAELLSELIPVLLELPEKEENLEEWLAAAVEENDLSNHFDIAAAEAIVWSAVSVRAEEEREWKAVYQKWYSPQSGDAAAKARGIILQAVCPFKERSERKNDSSEIKQSCELLAGLSEKDEILVRLGNSYLNHGKVRRKGELRPYTQLAFWLAGGTEIWKKYFPLIQKQNVQEWDEKIRREFEKNIQCDRDTVTSLMSLLLQHGGVYREVKVFYRKWFSSIYNASYNNSLAENEG